jgi:DNA-directed RNA polymerase I subunit RPA1
VFTASAGTGGSTGNTTVTQLLRLPMPDPLLSLLRPSTHLGCMSEAVQRRIDSYVACNPHHALNVGGSSSASTAASSANLLTPTAFTVMLWVKAARALVQPGEPVGVVAAQSIGEPSTQMTLNTFHLAGSGGANVTLGIPRLREIVMTASPAIKTPLMTLPILTTGSAAADAKAAADLAQALSPLPFRDVLAGERADGGIAITEQLHAKQIAGCVGCIVLLW